MVDVCKVVLNDLDQWPALHAYFDRQVDIEPTNAQVQRVASQLKDPEVKLICHFVHAIQPLNWFSTAFQTHASHIGTLDSDTHNLITGSIHEYFCWS